MTVPTTTESSFEEFLSGIRVHDVDTHIGEPSDLWTSRMSKAKWGDKVPHVRDKPVQDNPASWKIGARSWFTGETQICDQIASLVGGNYDEDTARAAYDPKARLAWMDRNGMFSQLLYPNIVAFYPNAFVQMDRDLSIACIQAYNDFQTEFSSEAPDRLIPLTNLPWWDIDAAVKELGRCHDMGHKGVNLGWDFKRIGFPRLADDHWAPILNEAQERGLSVNFHVGFNTETLENDLIDVKTDLDGLAFAAMFFLGNANCITELIAGGICDKYPKLNFVSVESGCGYLPYLIEALEWQFLNNNLYKKYPHMLLPSEYFRRQIFGTFWFEHNLVDLIGLYPDNFMFESDFPHSTSLTPAASYEHVLGPHDTIVANLSGLPHDLLRKVLHDNAARVYGLS